MNPRLVSPVALGALLALAALQCVHAQPAAPASAAGPQASATEIEFWRSAERQNTSEAYRAYLAAFPEGVFAPLARSALGVSAARPPVAVAAAPRASTALKYFSEESKHTGALTFNIGDRFAGPGVVTVGWAGAKKQFVLPPGEWVVLGAGDFKSDQSPLVSRVPTTTIVHMNTLVFGRFSGARLGAAMVFQTNIRPAVVLGWQDLAGCRASGATTLFQESTQSSALRSECASLQPVAEPLAGGSTAMAETRGNLERMGAHAQGAALATTVATWEDRNGYLGVTRLDWPGVSLGLAADRPESWTREGVAAEPARAALVRSLIEWARQYRPVAIEGFRHAIVRPNLVPGQPAEAAATFVKDVEPAGAAPTSTR